MRARAYRKGHLAFDLEGKRLRGSWDLVRMRAKPEEKGKDNWLLIKRSDRVAAARRPEKMEPKGKAAPMPRMISPQLATLVDAAPTGDDWIYESKYDGYRMLCRIEKGRARLSRNGKDWTARFPRHAQALAKLPVRQAWLDGEMAVFLPDGTTSFQALQNALDERAEANVRYAMFDLVYLDGRDWTGRPLLERKQRLHALLHAAGKLPLTLYSEHLEGSGEDAWRHACEHGLEGLVGKRRDSVYVQERSSLLGQAEMPARAGSWSSVATPTPTARAAALAHCSWGSATRRVRCAMRARSGPASTTASWPRCASDWRASRNRSPFAGAAGAQKGVHWVKPTLVADITFTGWTDEGLLRQASFAGLREDKPAAQVQREKAAQKRVENVVAGVAISHPVCTCSIPLVHATKLDLARYYESVGQWILPHLRDRPLSLVRCPRGPAQNCFFQRNAHETMPTRGEFIVADTLPALAQLVQLGVIELHTWGSRAEKPLLPDRMIVDLDPDPDLPWAGVVDGATWFAPLLNELRLEELTSRRPAEKACTSWCHCARNILGRRSRSSLTGGTAPGGDPARAVHCQAHQGAAPEEDLHRPLAQPAGGHGGERLSPCAPAKALRCQCRWHGTELAAHEAGPLRSAHCPCAHQTPEGGSLGRLRGAAAVDASEAEDAVVWRPRRAVSELHMNSGLLL